MQRVVFIDRDRALLGEIATGLAGADRTVETFESLAAALERLRGAPPVDALVVSLEGDTADPVTVIDRTQRLPLSPSVIAIVDPQTVERGAESLRLGAFSYLLRPFSIPEIEAVLDRLREEHGAVSEPDDDSPGDVFCGMVGAHASMRSLFRKVRRIGELASHATVLILGESGTGKELVARAIHALAAPPAEPFLALNCGAIHPQLLEDQLFGHVRGAFTGAVDQRAGCLVAAGEGTLFLDEITEMAAPLQVKLLRAIQEREVYPLGADRPVAWRARLIAASNRDVEREVDESRFRRDLYYRIKVIELAVPPLRDRIEDVPALAGFFLDQFARNSGRRCRLSPESLELLCRHPYPGNVRELRNAVESACTLGGGELIRPEDLPRELRAPRSCRAAFPSLAELERDHIVRALTLARGKKVQAARYLQIDRNRLYRLIRKYRIQSAELFLE